MPEHTPISIIDPLTRCPLFNNFTNKEIDAILSCFQTQIKEFETQSVIISNGDEVNHIYIVIEGMVDIVKETFNGNRHLMMSIGPASIFAEGIVCTKKRISPVTVLAKTRAKILYFPYQRIIQMCSNSCSFHSKLIFNMMLLLGEKNYKLNTKLNVLLLNGIQEKIAHYLLETAEKENTLTFTISLNRTNLAEYLNVSRPSMCRELTKLQQEGFIDYEKNTFTILDRERLIEICEK